MCRSGKGERQAAGGERMPPPLARTRVCCSAHQTLPRRHRSIHPLLCACNWCGAHLTAKQLLPQVEASRTVNTNSSPGLACTGVDRSQRCTSLPSVSIW